MLPEYVKSDKDIIIAIDYETADDRGASYQFFRKDFRIFSVSTTWRNPSNNEMESYFTNKQDEIKELLTFLSTSGHKIVAHNLPYEMGCTHATYGLTLNWYADTMRLSQLRDGGGDEFAVTTELTIEQEMAIELGEVTEKDIVKGKKGLSLEACAMRFLDDEGRHSHKHEAHSWLEEHHGIKKNHGRFLDLLPYEQLKQYNIADTEVTLLIYETQVEYFKSINFNWHKDNLFYLTRAKYMTGAYHRGLCIDQRALLDYIYEIEAEIEAINQKFRTMFKKEIELVERRRFVDSLMRACRMKTPRGTYNRIFKTCKGKYPEEYTFNINSANYLKLLFCDVLGMNPQFLTPKGSPSFKASHLSQWGEGGLILQKRKKRMLVLTQCINTFLDSLHDEKTHPGIKISGTRTNRVAGGRI